VRRRLPFERRAIALRRAARDVRTEPFEHSNIGAASLQQVLDSGTLPLIQRVLIGGHTP